MIMHENYTQCCNSCVCDSVKEKNEDYIDSKCREIYEDGVKFFL